MFDYSGIKMTADRLIRRYGSQVTIRDAANVVNFTTYVVKTKYLKGLIADTLIDASNDDAYIVQFNGTVIESSYYVEFGVNDVRTITRVHEIKPGSTLIAYKLEVSL